MAFEKSTKQQILQAACEIAGGSQELADRLGVSEALLRKFMSKGFELPDHLLLRTVDIILAEREARLPPAPADEPLARESVGDH